LATLITSRSNPRVKHWKALAAKPSDGYVWIEGEHLVQEALRSSHTISELIVLEGAAFTGMQPTALVSSVVMDVISQLESPSSCAAVVHLARPEVTVLNSDCILLEGIQDPGNVGTMLRCAWAFGVQHAVLLPGCASAWSMKALRAGQGAQFFLQVHERWQMPQLRDVLQVPLYVTSLRKSAPIHTINLRVPCALAFGSEGQGASTALQALATQTIHIPMLGQAESLNVAAACAVALYEQQRQRHFMTVD
jgi:RNA methyltransferase, TrmH family